MKCIGCVDVTQRITEIASGHRIAASLGERDWGFYLCVSLALVFSSANGESPTTIETLGGQWRIAAMNHPEHGYDIFVKNTETKTSFYVQYPRTISGRVEQKHVFRDRLVALGSLGSMSDFILTCDLNAPEDVSYHEGFHPVVSQAGGRIAFQRFYPRYAPIEGYAPAVEVLDLKSGSTETRTVFPVKPWEERDAQGRVHNLVSPLVWSPDGERLAFFDKHSQVDDWESYDIYWVVITFPPTAFSTADVRPIAPEDYVKTDMYPEKIAFYLQSLGWLEDDALCGRFISEDSYWRAVQVKISPDGEFLGGCEE